MAKPINIEGTINVQVNEISAGFDRIAAGALGGEKIRKILTAASSPLRAQLNSRFNSIASTGLRKKDRIPFKNVRVEFVAKPSRKMPNVIRIGPVGYGWQAIHLIEYGTVNRGKTGVMPATPFMRMSVAQTEEEVTLAGVEMITDAISKAAQEAGFVVK